MNILLCVGISGSGKSTWAERFLAAHPDYICINRDTIRLSLVKSLDGYYQRPDLNKLENIVNEVTDCILDQAYRKKFNVLVDNTNLNTKYINWFKNFRKTADDNPNWNYKLFDCHPTIAKTRVMQRDLQGYAAPGYEDSLPWHKIEYIDKQAEQYNQIKNYLLTNYKENE
jgi:adenylate kinase family enzyme